MTKNSGNIGTDWLDLFHVGNSLYANDLSFMKQSQLSIWLSTATKRAFPRMIFTVRTGWSRKSRFFDMLRLVIANVSVCGRLSLPV